MKKLIFLCIVCVSVTLSSCGLVFVRKIDDPDGTIADIKSGKDENIEIDTEDIVVPPLAVIDNILVRSTGAIISIPRCGVCDGEITSFVGNSETPTDNDTSNFGDGFQYQRVGEAEFDILVSGKWIRFVSAESEKFSGTPSVEETDLVYEAIDMIDWYSALDEQKKRIVDARFYYDNSESVDTSEICSYPKESDTSVGVGKSKFYDELCLVVETRNVTTEGLNIVFTLTDEQAEYELATGMEFALEKLSEQGEYRPLELVCDEDVVWHLPAYLIEYGRECVADVKWEYLYGKLDSGKYRISKQVSLRDRVGNFHSHMIYGYFEIR